MDMKLDNWIEDINKRLRRTRSATPIADALEMLRSELLNTDDKEKKLYLYSLIVTELQTQGRLEEAEAAIRARVDLHPQMPDGWISLALHHYYFTHNLEKALSAINAAIERSVIDGNFVRQSHLERIRIALSLEDFSLVEESIRILIEHKPRSGTMDVELESEFLPLIPVGSVSAKLIKEYTKNLPSKA